MQAFLTTLILGVVTGAVYALASTGIVLTYKTSGILNFGYGALVLFTTFVYWSLAVNVRWPAWAAAIFVILFAAPAIGFLLDGMLFRKIRGQPIVIAVIATVGLAVLFQGIVVAIWGGATRSVPSLFPHHQVRLPGKLYVGVDQFALLGIAIALAVGLTAMFRYTRLGVAFRAVVDNAEVAGLMAVNSSFVSGLAWAMSTAFAALTGILLVPRLLLDPNFLTPFIITQVFGAAIVGYLGSLPLAWAGGLFLGVSQQLLIKYVPFTSSFGNLRYGMPFLMIIILVLVAPKSLRLASLGESFIVKVREIPRHASQNQRALVAVACFAILALVPTFTQSAQTWQFALARSMITAIIFLSLVVLTGYSGQISLGHTAFMGIGALTTAHLIHDLGLPVWVAFFLGPLAAVPAGALLGVVAVRVRGLFLALITLAFAFMAYQLFFQQVGITGGPGGVAVPRPPGARSDTAFFYLVLVVLALFVLLAVNLRTGRTGRVLAAIRDSETASRAVGINVFKYKVIVFAISAGMAGMGGVLYTMIQQSANRLTEVFIPFYSLVYLTIAVVGGIFSAGGAIAAGIAYGVYTLVFQNVSWMLRLELIFFGLGATLALARNPEGLFGEFRWLGGAILRALDRRPQRREVLPVAGGQE